MRCRAVRLTEHGKPLTVDDIEVDGPVEGEVVVDTALSPVGRYGALGRLVTDGLLFRGLGTEGSDTLDDRSVLIRGDGLGTRRDGLWSTRAMVLADVVIDTPDGADLAAAEAMGVAGLTVWRASGGVGLIAVSVASSLGATVWEQTSSQSKSNWIASAGLDLLQPRGRLVIFGTTADGHLPLPTRKGPTVDGYAGLIEPDDSLAGHVKDVMEALRDGWLEVVVDRTVPLEQVNGAFEFYEQDAVRGEVLLDLSG